MRRVRSRDTSLERRVRSALHRRGLRFRLSYPLFGKPDVVFVRARVAVFLDSCFWHGCPLHVRLPKSRTEYWYPKIQRNAERDAQTNAAYARSGWKALRFWEHDLTDNFDRCIKRIAQTVRRRRALTRSRPHRFPAMPRSSGKMRQRLSPNASGTFSPRASQLQSKAPEALQVSREGRGGDRHRLRIAP
jgi:DNA mismatch endonuclease (patch repair protein)